MFTGLRLSLQWPTRAPWVGLSSTFLGSLTLTAILYGAQTFVQIATQERNVFQEVVASRQFISMGSFLTLPAWSIHVSYNGTLKEALMKATNSTNANPRASPTKRYRPRLSEYELACNRLDAQASPEGPLLVSNNGCANVTILTLGASENFRGAYIVRESKSRAKFVASVPVSPSDISTYVRVDYLEDTCLTFNTNLQVHNVTKAGITSSPSTVLTKCLLPSGQSISLSTTAIRFSAPRRQMFNSITSSIFKDKDELVAGMQNSINNGTLTTLPADLSEQVVVMEVMVSGTEVSVLVCTVRGSTLTEDPHVVCAYTATSVLIVKAQPMNPDIAGLLTNRGLNPKIPGYVFFTTVMSLYHLPLVIENKLSFAIPKILGASSVATDYLTSLGHNFVLDWDGSMLYVTYDTAEIIKGYEIPNGLFWTLVGVMAGCMVFLVYTKIRVEDRYKQSLYVAVSKELNGGRDDVAPQLHRFDPKTLRFEGRRIVATGAAQVSKERRVY
ncbi:hypothetical protein BG015_004228 [Linnemannia schmuckeri]|uniref:Transmembrane protein n=1 Tax=Linnemannia schmuckeri TaxID=64567 RepID=A0A9P5REM2_9FUNG|nr:hypothetical protein BG015_004228 [Linnemannia schmuckeri]